MVVGLHAGPDSPTPGHVVRALAARMTVPLVVVPASAPARRVPHRILFPLNGTPGVSAAAGPVIASWIAAGMDALALHVYEPATAPRFHDGPQDEVVWCHEFLAQHVADLEIRLTTRPGPFVPALLACAAASDVDLIAMPVTPGKAGTHGSLLRRVLQETDRPVALLPLPRGPADRRFRGARPGDVRALANLGC